jgi:Ca2+-binding RTX toxin-like protein
MITDGKLSLDARGGINITSEDNLFIDTKNKTLSINIGNGKINLGTDGELDYALKGNVLLDILREFMEIVGQQIMITPAGQTAPGATNKARLNTLIGKLNDSLSKTIQLK